MLKGTLLRAAALAAVTLLASSPSWAFRLIQNTTVGRVSAGAAVSCNASGGFTHWTNANIPWYHNTLGQGAGGPRGAEGGRHVHVHAAGRM